MVGTPGIGIVSLLNNENSSNGSWCLTIAIHNNTSGDAVHAGSQAKKLQGFVRTVAQAHIGAC